MRQSFLALTFLSSAASVAAEDLLFSLPADCSLGQNCFIQNYVDVDPSPSHKDFTCGPLSYDGHKGTDIRLSTLAEMNKGTKVLSAAPGRVSATRDGMPDIASNDPDAPDLGGKDCGNGLVIDHGDGWETQYCHMKNQSLSVNKGDTVARGAPLGEIGLSGRTEFPHIHMSIRKDGQVVDPFSPDNTQSCGLSTRTLWAEPVEYTEGGLLDIGFADAVPEFAAIKAGFPSVDVLPGTASALVVWGFAFGTRPGDEMELSILGPGGWQHAQTVVFDKSQAQLFRASGRKRPKDGWPEGQYIGTVILTREGKRLGSQTVELTISQ